MNSDEFWFFVASFVLTLINTILLCYILGEGVLWL